MSVFDEIYKTNLWGFGSGHGSLPSLTKGYRDFLQGFIEENHIKRVVDYGAGDWQFSRLLKWGDVEYTGFDIVPSLVEQNMRKFGTDKIKFKLVEPGLINVPEADLLIVKDVLQHMPNSDVKEFVVKVVPRFKYALITNCILSPAPVNSDISLGGFRGLDIRKTPFSIDAKVVFSFSGPRIFSWRARQFFPAWKKLVLLVDQSRHAIPSDAR